MMTGAVRFLLSLAVVAMLAGCRSPDCIEIYDLQTGQRHGVPFLPGFLREMIVGINPDGQEFLTFGRVDGNSHVRWRDMTGRLIGENRLDLDPDVGVAATILGWAVDWDERVVALMGHWYDRPPGKEVDGKWNEPKLIVGSLEDGTISEKRLDFSPPVPDNYNRGSFGFAAGMDDSYWLVCTDFPYPFTISGPVQAVHGGLFKCTRSGDAVAVFQGDFSLNEMVVSFAENVIAVRSRNKSRSILVFNAINGKLIHEIPIREHCLRWTGGFALDGKGERLLMTGDRPDGFMQLHLLDWRDGTLRSTALQIARTRNTHLGSPLFLGDGLAGVSVGHSGMFREFHDQYWIIDLETGQIVKRIKGYRMQRFFATPDGRYVLFQTH